MLEALTAIYEWFASGIYAFFTDAFASLVEWLFLAYLNSMIWAIEFGWGIAQTIISDLNISASINNAWSSMPSNYVNTLTFFRVPEVILNLISAYITRFVLKFIPFL